MNAGQAAMSRKKYYQSFSKILVLDLPSVSLQTGRIANKLTLCLNVPLQLPLEEVHRGHSEFPALLFSLGSTCISYEDETES